MIKTIFTAIKKKNQKSLKMTASSQNEMTVKQYVRSEDVLKRYLVAIRKN